MKIPRGNGEILAQPPYSQWKEVLSENQRLRSSYRRIGNLDFPQISQGLGQRLTKLGISSDRPLLLTGHQPEFIHPGIWARFLSLEKLSRELDSQIAAFVLDSDENNGLSLYVPTANSHLERKRLELDLERGKVYESLPAVSKEDWELFLTKIDQLLNFPQAEEARFNLRHYLSFYPQAETYPQFWSEIRRFTEGATYPESPISQIFSAEFGLFFLEIARRSLEFAQTFNDALATWRQRRKVRGYNIPFPDLEINLEKVELPFWYLKEGRRYPLYLASDGRLDGLPYSPEEVPISSIRPRASTLTIFLRLFACDLFLHGAGGADYEEVNDLVIRDFFKITPPSYVSLTLSLFFPSFQANRLRYLRKTLREMEVNPEKFFDPALLAKDAPLISRKKALLSSGKLSKDDFRQLKKINSALLGELKGLTKTLKEELRQLEEDEEVLAFREYPFLLFNPDYIRQILDKL